MQNSFLEAMSERNNEAKYKEFVKHHGKATFLTEEMVTVGLQHFVPFINSKCARSICIYDLSQLESFYSNKYDTSDDFQANGDIDCHYCDENIKFGDFFTSQALTDDVEDLFHKLQDKPRSPFRRDTGSPSIPRKAKEESPKKGTLLENGILLKKTTLGTLPKLETKNDIGLLMGTFLAGKLQQKKKLTSQITDVSALKLKLMKFDVSDFRKSSFAKANSYALEVCRSLASQYKVKQILEFFLGEFVESMPTVEELQQILSGNQSNVNCEGLLLAYWKTRFCRERGKLLSFWIYKLDKRVLSSPRFLKWDGLTLDPKVITANPDSPYVNFLFSVEDQLLLVALNKPQGELVYTHLQSKSAKRQDVAAKSEAAFSCFDQLNKDVFKGQLTYSTKTINTIEMPCSPAYAFSFFILSRFFQLDDKLLSETDAIVKQVIMDLGVLIRGIKPELNLSIFDSDRNKIDSSNGATLISPTYTNTNRSKDIKSTRLLVPAIQVHRQDSGPKKKSEIERKIVSVQNIAHQQKKGTNPGVVKSKNKVVHVKAPSLTNSLTLEDSIGLSKDHIVENSLPEEPKASSQKPIFLSKPKPSPVFRLSKNNKIPDGSKSVDDQETKPKDSQLEDIKKLLNFYFAHDRTRYKHLVNKCQQSFDPVFLEKIKIRRPSVAKSGESSVDNIPKSIQTTNKEKSLASNEHLETRESPSKPVKTGHKKVASLEGAFYLPKGSSLPKLESSASNSIARKNSFFKKSMEKDRVIESLPDSARGSQREIQKVEMGKEVRESVFNATLKNIEQKQIKKLFSISRPPSQKSFVFKTDFFGLLVDIPSQGLGTIKHKAVQHFTLMYTGKGHMVFDCHRCVLVPIKLDKDGCAHYMVASIEDKGKFIRVFDPVALPKSDDAKRCGQLLTKYISKEVELRTGSPFDKKEIVTVVEDSPKDSLTESGHWSLFFAGMILEGKKPTISKKDRDAFLSEII